MEEKAQKEEQYIELPKVEPREVVDKVFPILSRFLKIKQGEIDVWTFEEIINAERERLRAFIDALPELNTSVISTFLGFVSLLIGFFMVKQQLDPESLLILMIASFLSIWGILVIAVFILSRVKKFALLEFFFKIIPLMITPREGSYFTYLTTREFDPLIRQLEEYPKVVDYFEDIRFEGDVYPWIKSIQLMALVHIFLFIIPLLSLLTSAPVQNIQTYSDPLILLLIYFEISCIVLIYFGTMRVRNISNDMKKIVAFYVVSWVGSFVFALKIIVDNALFFSAIFCIFILLYIVIGNFLHYPIKFQNIKRLLIRSHSVLDEALFLLKTSGGKTGKLKELEDYSSLVHRYFMGRMYNPTPPLLVDVKNDIFEIQELYPDLGYLYFIDEDFVLLPVAFVMDRLHKVPEGISL